MHKLEFFMPGTNGMSVMLIHGLTGAPAEMKLVAKKFNRLGYTVFAPLLAGHGVDEATLVKTRWQDWLDSLGGALDFLKRETDKVFTGGICVGGKLGMMLAHQNPGRIAATSIYSTCFQYDGWGVPWYFHAGKYVIPAAAHIPILKDLSFSETNSIGIKDEKLRRWMAQQSAEGVLDKFPLRSLAEMLKLGNTLKSAAPEMKTPCVILHAQQDDLANIRNANLLSHLYGGQHKMIVLEDSYHMIHVDRENGLVVKQSDQFFKNF